MGSAAPLSCQQKGTPRPGRLEPEWVMTTIKAGRKHRHAVRFPNSELKPHGHADPRGHEAGRAQGERARHSVPPSGFWLQGADSQQVTPTRGSHAGLRQIWGPPSLSPSLPGPAQKPKDTSASDNEWFILFRVPGEKSRGLPPILPLQEALPTHMQPGMGTEARLGHQPVGPRGDALGSHKK